MAASTQTISLVQPSPVAEQWKAACTDTIAAETGLLGSRPVANLIMEYLNLPSIEGWITEWTGERGREIVEFAVTRAQVPLNRDAASLVMQYLQKSDVFGLKKVEEAAGGAAELTKLIGKYNPEKPLPFDIDDEMQAPLSQHFDAETLRAFHEYRTSQGMPRISRMTELYSLYWGPAGVTPNIAEQLGKKHGAGFEYFWDVAREEHGNARTSGDCWIAFPNDVFGRNKTVLQQEALIPAGFEFSHFQDAVFCVFVRFSCTGVRIMSLAPWTYTRCQEETQGYKLVVGSFGPGGLVVSVSYDDDVIRGVAPLRKFCLGH